MSIKVYLHYELAGVPHKTSKLSVPKKWVTDKSVTDVIELFTDSYNKTNPNDAIEKDEVHLVDSNEDKIFSDDIIGIALQDRFDYHIKHGKHLRRALASTLETTSSTALRCRNYGCNQHYEEHENNDTACRHHVAPPIFHDCIKAWSCCKERKAYDWEEFQQIEGCTLGPHSTIDPKLLFASSPTVAAAVVAEEKNPGSVAPVIKSIADFNQQNPEAASAANSAIKTLSAPRKSSRLEDGLTAKCQNKGCQRVFSLSENAINACVYHGGQPVFHDAIKYWSCCPQKKCYDFESFLEVPGCCTGYHDDGVIDTLTGVEA
jgi:hypothetical protein